MKNITVKEIRKITSEDMITYIENREQAEYWYNLVHDKHDIKNGGRPRKDGSRVDVCRKLSFPVARMRYFEKFYNIVDDIIAKRNELEKSAEDILALFAE